MKNEDVDFLTRVIEEKKQEVEENKGKREEKALREEAGKRGEGRSFAAALQGGKSPRIIGELKKASPSRGRIRDEFSPGRLAAELEEGGAVALSVLTEKVHFEGSLDFLREARNACGIPILRKDFIIDPYQVLESRAGGADALLLIVAALGKKRLEELIKEAHGVSLDCLVEVHSRQELDLALEGGARIVGINSRNLKTLAVNVEVTKELRPLVPAGILTVAESGIKTREDITDLLPLGFDAFLVGEALMASDRPGRKLRELVAC